MKLLKRWLNLDFTDDGLKAADIKVREHESITDVVDTLEADVDELQRLGTIGGVANDASNITEENKPKWRTALDILNEAAIDSKIQPVSDAVALKVTSNTPIVGGSGTKVSVDTKGLVTSVEELEEEDIPDISADKISGGVLPPEVIPTIIVDAGVL